MLKLIPAATAYAPRFRPRSAKATAAVHHAVASKSLMTRTDCRTVRGKSVNVSTAVTHQVCGIARTLARRYRSTVAATHAITLTATGARPMPMSREAAARWSGRPGG